MKKFCAVPWREFTFSAQNTVAVCCKWVEDQAQNIKSASSKVDDRWNADAVKNLRKRFMNAENIPECSFCWRDESNGKISARMRRNQHYFGKSDINIDDQIVQNVLSETSDDGHYSSYHIEGLFIATENLCQLRCITCNPASSRNIMKDYEKFGWDKNYKTRRTISNLSYADKNVQNLWQDLKSKLSKITTIRVTGGEPSINKNFLDLLQFCVDEGVAKNIFLLLVTNGVKIKPRFIELLKKFKQVHIDISLDGIGDLEEYIRFPTNWKSKEKNIDIIKNNFPSVGILTTVCNLNLIQLPKIIEFVKTKNLIHNLEILKYPDVLGCWHLPSYLKDDVSEKLKKFITNDTHYILNDRYEKSKILSNSINSIISVLKSQNDEQKLKELNNLILKYNLIRRKYIEDILPEFVKIQKNITK